MGNSALVAGCTIARRFEVEGAIGSGGMGTVYRARDRERGGRVALKLLQPHGTPQESERFAREALLLAELHHPHIVSYVTHGVDESGRPYLVMEYLEGEDLAQYLARRRLSPRECRTLLLGVSAALGEAHSRGIVHRDLKPSNLFLRGGKLDDVVVLDFGIARRALRAGALTRTGAVLGTPEYMAPEQARGERDIGPPADVFSLGCVVYECLTGRAPFTGEHVAAVLIKVLLEDPPPPELLCTDLPPALCELLQRMLRKAPAERFADGLALHDAVRRLQLLSSEAPPGSPAARAVTVLTPQEQHIFSVAVAIPGADEADLNTLTPGESYARFAVQRSVQAELGELGASVELLGNGALVATVLPSASASDQALLAARCGLLLKERLPAAVVAVATGRGLLRGQIPIGEAVDRAMQLLERERLPGGADAGAGVFLDTLSENLLSGRFEITRSGGRACIAREMNPDLGEDVRKLLGQPTPCVGREQELGMLDSLLASCIADSAARAVGIVAPPGMGKSRLRLEFLRSASQRYPGLVILLGRGDPMSTGSPYGILGQALRRHCGLVGGEPRSVQQDRLRERLGRSVPPAAGTRISCFLGELCGVGFSSEADPALHAARSDPKVMREQVTQAFLEWLTWQCRVAPLLLVLEDLHWGDTLSVQLIEQAVRELEELPLLLLVLGRPEVRELFPSFWNSRVLQEVPLRALSRRASERLAQEVLRRALGSAVDAAVVERIVGQAAGSPLFLEELIRAVAEGRGDVLPETVLAMLLARLSQLDAEARQVLRAASVFGESFTPAGVTALIGDVPSAPIDSTLLVLLRAEFIEKERDGRGAGAERYKFRHALVRDAAYSLLTRENRLAAHRLAGRYLEQSGSADPVRLAEHAQKGEEAERAVRFYIEAAKQALASFDLGTAQRLAQRALDCQARDEPFGIVHAIQACVAYLLGDFAAAYEHALQAGSLTRFGSYWWAKTLSVHFHTSFMIHRFEQAWSIIPGFLQAEPEPDARAAYLEVGVALTTLMASVGMREPAAGLARKLSAVAAHLRPEDQGLLRLLNAWRIYNLEPDPFKALKESSHAIELFRRASDRHHQSLGLLYQGMVLTSLGCLAAGEQALREGLALEQRLSNTSQVAVLHLHLGINLAAQLSTGVHADSALQEARSIAEIYGSQQEMGPAVQGAVHLILARVHSASGDRVAAESAVQASLASFAAMVPYRLSVVPHQVELLLLQQRTAEARLVAQQAVQEIDERGGLGYCEVGVRLALALSCFAEGDTDAGKGALRAALTQVQLRAAKIESPEIRHAYLHMPENQRIFELARAHGLRDLEPHTNPMDRTP